MNPVPGKGEEEDYMSDAFLQSILPPEHQPLTSKTAAAAARKNALRDRAKNKAKARASAPAAPPQKRSRAAQEAEARSSGMSRPLDQQNKGFRMLVGMGFSPGEGLGKNADGVSEPVGINLKSGRGGLGKDALVRQQRAQALAEKERRRVALLAEKKEKGVQQADDFRARMRRQQLAREMERDVDKAQRACRQLDSAEGLTSGPFWPKEAVPALLEDDIPPVPEPSANEADEEPPIPVDVQLDNVTEYLRAQYHYCIWCGTAYGGEDDLARKCPGNRADAHD